MICNGGDLPRIALITANNGFVFIRAIRDKKIITFQNPGRMMVMNEHDFEGFHSLRTMFF